MTVPGESWDSILPGSAMQRPGHHPLQQGGCFLARSGGQRVRGVKMKIPCRRQSELANGRIIKSRDILILLFRCTDFPCCSANSFLTIHFSYQFALLIVEQKLSMFKVSVLICPFGLDISVFIVLFKRPVFKIVLKAYLLHQLAVFIVPLPDTNHFVLLITADRIDTPVRIKRLV